MLRVHANKVAIAPLLDPDKIGSIVVPDQAKERCDQGVIKYVGSDVKHVKVGDHVLFSGYSGVNVQLEGEGLLILMHEDFLTAVIETETTEVPGLFFKTRAGEVLEANWEMAVYLHKCNLEDLGMTQQIRTKEKFEDARRNNIYDERSR